MAANVDSVGNDLWVIEGAAVPRFPWFTRANAGETMPDPVSPLGWTLLWDRALLPGWNRGNVSFGLLRGEEVAGVLRLTAATFGGYFYLNLSAIRMIGVRLPGLTVEAIDHSNFGGDPNLPPFVPQDGDESPECTALLTERLGWIMSVTEWPELDRCFEAAVRARLDRPDLSALDDTALVARARSIAPICEDLYEMHVWTGLGCGVSYGALAAALAETDGLTRVNDLVSGLGDIESAKPVGALWELSRIDPADPGFGAAFDDFIAEYGCRGLGDWDLASPSWEVRPDQARHLLDALRRVDDTAAPAGVGERTTAMREKLTAELIGGLDGEQADAAQGAVQAAGFFLRARERSRGGLVKAMNEMRVPIHELARRRYEAGDLAEPGDLFLLLDSELDEFLADPAAFAPTIEQRRETYRSLYDYEPPFFIDRPIPLSSMTKRVTGQVAPAPAGTVLTGISGGVAGQVTGRARVLSDPYDEHGIEPGDILVARQTDPTWTPLFLDAGAVVVEFGSPISHAVIVSRELGKSCIVSVEGAASRIPDGATLMVDGVAGTVTVL